eukprot:Pompholyxophrys_punicea_v1_NODE_1223_length_855_cov_7.988750.p2 type:complete len:127 gc:universal NODE_1223_length_855_cov_7.988750:666-286(-)
MCTNQIGPRYYTRTTTIPPPQFQTTNLASSGVVGFFGVDSIRFSLGQPLDSDYSALNHQAESGYQGARRRQAQERKCWRGGNHRIDDDSSRTIGNGRINDHSRHGDSSWTCAGQFRGFNHRTRANS